MPPIGSSRGEFGGEKLPHLPAHGLGEFQDKRLGLDKEPVAGGPAFLLQFPQPTSYFFGVQTGLQVSPQQPPGTLSLDNIYPQLSTSR